MKLRLILLAAAMIVLGVLAASWLVTRPRADTHHGRNTLADLLEFALEMRPVPMPTEPQLREFQAQADAACMCDRHRPNASQERECWAEFDRNIARFEHFDTSTMCMEESVSEVCFGSSITGQNRCVLKQREYGTCSAAEAREQIAQARSSGESGCG